MPVAELRLVRRLHSAFYVSNFRDEVLSDLFQGLWILLDGLSTDEAVDCEGNGRFNPFSIFAENCAAEHAAGDSSYNLRKPLYHWDLGPICLTRECSAKLKGLNSSYLRRAESLVQRRF